MIRISFLKVLVSSSIAVEIYMIMYICIRTYASTVYSVFVCECVCIYFKFVHDF